jgi:predicted metal-dependent hydrolase
MICQEQWPVAETIIINNKEIKYTVTRRAIRHARLEMKTGNLVIIAPERMMDVTHLLKKYSGWIEKRHDQMTAMAEQMKNREFCERTEKEFKDMIFKYTDLYSRKTGMTYKKIYFKNMKSRWGSCSSMQNISVNNKMSRLPERLVKYIICHEVTHLKIKNHSRDFYRALEREYGEYKNVKKELLGYWYAMDEKK